MSERFVLFVYGQLRRGEIGYERLGLAGRTAWLGPARVKGVLYDLGAYPGLVLGGDRLVHGELLGFDDPALWAALDEYEEYDPDNSEISEYRRIEVDLLDLTARAWTYVYARSAAGRPLLASGDWQPNGDRNRGGE